MWQSPLGTWTLPSTAELPRYFSKDGETTPTSPARPEEKRPWNAPGSSTIEIRIGRDRRLQRTTKTGTGLFARTSDVWLPSSSFLKPLRPCDAMTIKLQPRALAKSSIASAG